MPFDHTTTAEDIVRRAFSHATIKLESTLTCPPQKMLILLRHQGIVTSLRLTDRLVTIPRFIDAASNPADPCPVLMLSAPDTATYNVEQLTKAPTSPRADAEMPMGFASFVRRPGPEETELPIGGENRPLSPLLNASVLSNTSFARKSSTGAPSELFIRHASEALRRNPSLKSFAEGSMSPPRTQDELPALPLTVHVVYFSVYGERVEVEVPYLSTDPAQSIIDKACAAISGALVKPLEPSAYHEMALHYRRKDGTELSFFGSRILPLPKSTSPPTLFLARRHSSPSPRDSPQSSPMQTHAIPSVVPSDPSPPRTNGASTPAMNELSACRDMAAALRREYTEASSDVAGLTNRRDAIAALVAERDALLERRKASQDRWTECATVARDVERLRDQLTWFEREASQLRDRETSLTLKLHRLQTAA